MSERAGGESGPMGPSGAWHVATWVSPVNERAITFLFPREQYDASGVISARGAGQCLIGFAGLEEPQPVMLVASNITVEIMMSSSDS